MRVDEKFVDSLKYKSRWLEIRIIDGLADDIRVPKTTLRHKFRSEV